MCKLKGEVCLDFVAISLNLFLIEPVTPKTRTFQGRTEALKQLEVRST